MMKVMSKRSFSYKSCNERRKLNNYYNHTYTHSHTHTDNHHLSAPPVERRRPSEIYTKNVCIVVVLVVVAAAALSALLLIF